MRLHKLEHSALALGTAVDHGGWRRLLAQAQGASREMVPLLQQEANSLKADGEKANPELGVKATWAIQGVEVREQAGNEAQPWAGTIRFNITSEMRDVDGTPLVQRFDKRFEYVWSTAMNRWIIQYTPPAPAAR